MKKMRSTPQALKWSADFGIDYTDRNPQSTEEMNDFYKRNFGITRTELNNEFIGNLDRNIRILEVGCNIGIQLLCLQQMGFVELYGIELQHYAVELAKKRTKRINIIQGSTFDVPYKEGFFDLVFTSGLLIHIAPADIGAALDEIYRCTSTYIWGWEYYNDEYKMVRYRKENNLLWKTDFAKLYRERFPELELKKEKTVKYLHSSNVDAMFLLKKGN